MKRETPLAAILKAVEGRVNPQKLKQLRRYFVSALGTPDLSQPVEDPMILRRELIAQMRKERVPAGTIEALAQFYMGIIRRAALVGLILPPPEGPWTRTWQSVLDLAEEKSAGKAQVRSLAGWATEKGLEPQQVGSQQLNDWLEDLKIEEGDITAVWKVLECWTTRPTAPTVASDPTRAERLRRKASHGSVSVE